MIGRLHPSAALYGAERGLPPLPPCVHYAGSERYIRKALSLQREMGPVFTCLTLAGLVGSTYAAEIGTMKVSEEVDALEVMSIDPVYFLVMPRLIALSAAAVVLTIYADLIGIAGGALVARANFGVDLEVFIKNGRDALIATPAATHWSRSALGHTGSMGRAPGPLSPPTITQSIRPGPRYCCRSSGPRRGSHDRNLTAAGV